MFKNLGHDSIPTFALHHRDDGLLVSLTNGVATISNDPLASAFQYAQGAHSAVCGWGFVPGNPNHWRSAFSFAFDNAGSTTACRHAPCTRKHTGKAINGSLAVCRRAVRGSITVAKAR